MQTLHNLLVSLIALIISLTSQVAHTNPNSQTASLGQVGATVINPELPRVYVDTSLPATSATCTINVVSGGDLQVAINSANLGDTICLQAGATFSGNFILPNKTVGSGWITIRTSDLSKIPAPNTRINPSYSVTSGNSSMARITVPAADFLDSAISFESGAHNYRLLGLEIDTQYAGTDHTSYAVISTGNNETDLSLQPHDLIFDRDYIHGTPTGNNLRGILVGGPRNSVIDSYISNFHNQFNDSQAILIINSNGPIKIVNNYLEGAGENVLFGGGGTTPAGIVPSDIEIRHNYFYKPLSWQDNSTYRSMWDLKNLLEIKNAQRVLIDGNIFENIWPAWQDGTAIVLNGVDGPTSLIENISITNNIVKNSYGFIIASNNYGLPQLRSTNSILVKNNVMEMSNYNITYRIYQGDYNINIDHNTTFNPGSAFYAGDTPPPYLQNLSFTNNIVNHGPYGFIDWNGGSPNSIYATTTTVSNNLIVGVPSGYSCSAYPSSNLCPAEDNSISFVNYNNGIGGDYHLSVSSSYKGTAADGTDPGADIDSLNSATAGVITGNGSSILPPPPPTTDTTPPSTPTSLSAAAVSPSEIDLSWSPSSDNVHVAGYKVYRKQGTGSQSQISQTSNPNFNDASLSPSTSYSYNIASYDDAGNVSIQSLPSSATTLSSSTTPPTANKFIIGDRVHTTSKLKVRLTPTTKGKALCTQANGAYGTIIDGPHQANGYTWWNVNYDSSCDGWSAEDWLIK